MENKQFQVTNEESRFEKSFYPRVADVRENEYTNAAGEQKKQCFITINKEKNIAFVLPYSLDALKDKFHNERYPNTLNIPIVKDFSYNIKEKDAFKQVNGTELRNYIDYYITIGLQNAKIVEILGNNGGKERVSVSKNGISFIVDQNWIKESEYGPYLSVKHNSRIEVSRPKTEKINDQYEGVKDENGKQIYETQQVTWAYVKKAFDSKPRQRSNSKSFENKMDSAGDKSYKNNQTKSYKSKSTKEYDR